MRVAQGGGPVLHAEESEEVLVRLVLAEQSVLPLLVQGAFVDLSDALLAAIVGAQEIGVHPSVRSSVKLFVASIGSVLLGQQLQSIFEKILESFDAPTCLATHSPNLLTRFLSLCSAPDMELLGPTGCSSVPLSHSAPRPSSSGDPDMEFLGHK